MSTWITRSYSVSVQAYNFSSSQAPQQPPLMVGSGNFSFGSVQSFLRNEPSIFSQRWAIASRCF